MSQQLDSSKLISSDSRVPALIAQKKEQLLQESKKVLADFISQYIKDNNGKNRPNIISQVYEDTSKYEGEQKNGVRNGKGVYFYQNGDVYFGDWEDEIFHGKGCYLFSTGERYEGPLLKGKKNGQGKYLYSNGNMYEGGFSQDKKHGFGKFIYFSLGETYEGEWLNGKRQGKGMLITQTGDIFDGEWENDKKNGKGVFKNSNGSVYDGMWKADFPNGLGKMDYSNNDHYEGEWLSGRKRGFGKYYFSSGDRYEGDFDDDERHGNGMMFYANGDIYEGGWLDGERSGEGRYIYKNKIINDFESSLQNENELYVGEWRNDKKNGLGTLKMSNGDEYKGEWFENKKNGTGVYTFSNGDNFEGIFANDKRNGKGSYSWVDGRCFEGTWKDDVIDGKGVYLDREEQKQIYVKNEKGEAYQDEGLFKLISECCQVCFKKFGSRNLTSTKIICSRCNVSVHLACYGISTNLSKVIENGIEKYFFICDICDDGTMKRNILDCFVCGNISTYCKAYKIVDNFVVHVFCALFSQFFEVYDWKNMKFRLKFIPNLVSNEILTEKCTICNNYSNLHDLIKCFDCNIYSHLICLYIDSFFSLYNGTVYTDWNKFLIYDFEKETKNDLIDIIQELWIDDVKTVENIGIEKLVDHSKVCFEKIKNGKLEESDKLEVESQINLYTQRKSKLERFSNIITMAFCPNHLKYYCCTRELDKTEGFVCCDNCENWLHTKCLGISSEEAAEKTFFCDKCIKCSEFIISLENSYPLKIQKVAENEETEKNIPDVIKFINFNKISDNLQYSTLTLADYLFIMALGEECISFAQSLSELLSIASNMPFEFSSICYTKAKNIILKEVAREKSNIEYQEKFVILSEVCSKLNIGIENLDILKFQLETLEKLKIICKNISERKKRVKVEDIKAILSKCEEYQIECPEKREILGHLEIFETFHSSLIENFERKSKRIEDNLPLIENIKKSEEWENDFKEITLRYSLLIDFFWNESEIKTFRNRLENLSIFSPELWSILERLEKDLKDLNEIPLETTEKETIYLMNKLTRSKCLVFSINRMRLIEKYIQIKNFQGKLNIFKRANNFRLKSFWFNESILDEIIDPYGYLLRNISLAKIPEIKLSFLKASKNKDDFINIDSKKKFSPKISESISLSSVLSLANLNSLVILSKSLFSNEYSFLKDLLNKAILLDHELEYLIKQNSPNNNILEIEFSLSNIVRRIDEVNLILPSMLKIMKSAERKIEILHIPFIELETQIVLEGQKILKGEKITLEKAQKLIRIKRSIEDARYFNLNPHAFTVFDQLHEMIKFVKLILLLGRTKNEYDLIRNQESEICKIIESYIDDPAFFNENYLKIEAIKEFKNKEPLDYMEFIPKTVERFQKIYWCWNVERWLESLKTDLHQKIDFERFYELKKKGEKYFSTLSEINRKRLLDFWAYDVQIASFESDLFHKIRTVYIPKKGNDLDDNYNNFDKEILSMQSQYFLLPIRDINSERILAYSHECCLAAKKAEDLISLSKKKNVKIDLKTLFTLNEFRMVYQESNNFEIFKEIEKLTNHFKLLISQIEDLKTKITEKKEYLNKFKINQLKTYGNNMITLETAHFNAEIYSYLNENILHYEELIKLIKNLDDQSFDMKNHKMQLRKYKVGYEIFGKSISNFVSKNLENPLERLGQLSSLKNDLITKEILYGSSIEQLLSADWMFHMKCVLKGSLSFKFEDFGKETFEQLQKFKNMSLKSNGEASPKIFPNSKKYVEMLEKFGTTHSSTLERFVGIEYSNVNKDLSIALEAFDRIKMEMNKFKKNEETLIELITKDFNEQTQGYTFRKQLKTRNEFDSLLADILSTVIYEKSVFAYFANLKEVLNKLNKDIESFKHNAKILLASPDELSLVSSSQIMSLYSRLYIMPINLENSEKILFSCQNIIQKTINLNKSLDNLSEKEEKIDFLKTTDSLQLLKKFTWIKEIKELFEKIALTVDLDSFLMSIKKEESGEEREEFKLILEI